MSDDWQDANKTKPPEGREVLAVLKLVACEEIFYFLATWDGNHWVSNSMYRLAGVYAWIPLPKPPPIPAVSV